MKPFQGILVDFRDDKPCDPVDLVKEVLETFPDSEIEALIDYQMMVGREEKKAIASLIRAPGMEVPEYGFTAFVFGAGKGGPFYTFSGDKVPIYNYLFLPSIEPVTWWYEAAGYLGRDKDANDNSPGGLE